MTILRTALWLAMTPTLGPPPLDPVASWVLSGLLTICLGVIAYFLSRTFKRLDQVELDGANGRELIMLKIQESKLALEVAVGALRNDLAAQAGKIGILDNQVEEREKSADERHVMHQETHKQFVAQFGEIWAQLRALSARHDK